MKTWVEARSKEGRYGNVSDYVRDLIRRDQERQEAIGEIQGLIDEALESGAPQGFDMGAYLAEKTYGAG